MNAFLVFRTQFEIRCVAKFKSQVWDYKQHSAIRVYLLIYFCAAASTGNMSFIIKLICPLLLLQPKSLAKSDSVFCIRAHRPYHRPLPPKDIFNYSVSRLGLIKMSNWSFLSLSLCRLLWCVHTAYIQIYTSHLTLRTITIINGFMSVTRIQLLTQTQRGSLGMLTHPKSGNEKINRTASLFGGVMVCGPCEQVYIICIQMCVRLTEACA